MLIAINSCLCAERHALHIPLYDWELSFFFVMTLCLQQNMMSPYQQLAPDLIILWWKQLVQHNHVLSYSGERTLELQLS